MPGLLAGGRFGGGDLHTANTTGSCAARAIIGKVTGATKVTPTAVTQVPAQIKVSAPR
jgi:hypothetical protein